ncbi:MAG: hypothetical protein GX748_18760, partial [Lentisphaerae bacterium]|nr:hypothetical protein [Lentisphaerota bacterium]
QAIYLGAANNRVAYLKQDGGNMVLSGELVFSYPTAVNTQSELHQTGGTLTGIYNWRVGNNAGSYGRIIKTGGHLAHSGYVLGVGFSSTGTVHGVNASELRMQGGTMKLSGAAGLSVSYNAGSYGYAEFSGGVTDLSKKSITVGKGGGTGLLRVTGGWVTNVYTVAVGSDATSTGRLELSGGVLGVNDVASSSTGVDSSTVLLDGGILRHEGTYGHPDFIHADVKRVALTTNGAVVQLQGYDCTIPAKLVNETGHAGAFTKLGPTRLTLSSPDSAFTGRITVAEGQLRVTGGVYLTGGVVVEDGAWLNLYDSSSAYATIHDARTASGTISRIDGTMTLAPAGALTCGDGAVVGGGGTLAGGLVVEAGGALGADKDGTGGALDVTGAVDFAAGAGVALTGYVSEELETPVAVLNAAGGIAVAAPLTVSLDGIVKPSLRADLNAEGTTLSVRFQPIGTVLCVR